MGQQRAKGKELRPVILCNAAWPQHMAVSLWLTVRCPFVLCVEAEPRSNDISSSRTVRQSLTALCGGRAATHFYHDRLSPFSLALCALRFALYPTAHVSVSSLADAHRRFLRGHSELDCRRRHAARLSDDDLAGS